jgi:hypothetical protein
MRSWESDVAVLQLSLRDLIDLLNDYDVVNGFDYADMQSTDDSSHALDCDWSLPDES